jgi:hypothetical protein
MNRFRVSLASIALLASVVVPGCKRNAAGPGEAEAPRGRAAKTERRQAARPDLPRPYALPAQPPMALHVAAPSHVLGALEAYAGKSDDPRAVLRSLASFRGGEIEAALVPYVDLNRPWDAATIEGKTIASVPIERARLADVKRLLQGKPAAGKFGAVDLQRPAEQKGAKLAWLDDESATLALADDLRGLATAQELSRAYGKTPLYFTIDAAQAKAEGAIEFPFARVHVRGDGAHDFRITTEGAEQIEGLDAISNGALTGLLSSPDLAAGVSTKYAKYQQVIKDLTGRATRTLNEQNFLVRGVMEDMVKRFNAVVRGWNGRVLVGVGPQRHLVLALGSEDAKKSSGAVVSLVDSVLGNIELASSFGIKVPHFKFRKNRATAGGMPVHVVALANAKKQIPAELAPLLDSEGNLRVAFAGSPRAGALMVVVGPEAAETLVKWIDSTKDATPGSATLDHLVSATFATSTAGLAPLTEQQSPATFLQLRADRPATWAVVQRKGPEFDVHVRGPEPAKPRRTPPPRGGQYPHRRTAQR